MQYPWLEKMAGEGLIRKEALAHIYNSLGSLTKEANDDVKKVEQAAAAMGDIIKLVLGLGVVGGGKMMFDWNKARKLKNDILSNRSMIAAHEDFASEQEKAKARFDELTRIAPHVAANENLARGLVKSRLNEGFSAEDMQRLAIVQANHSPGSTAKELIPKLASVRPEALGHIVADVYLLTKTAAPFMDERFRKYLTTAAYMTGVPLLIGAGGGAVNLLASKVEKRKLEDRLKEAFSKAVKLSDPDKEPLRENMEKARQAFEALTHFAPHVALQPQAARAFMSKIVAYDQGMNISDIKDLAEIEKNLGATSKAPFSEGFKATAQMMGLQSSATKGFELATKPYATIREKAMLKELAPEAGLSLKDVGLHG